MDISTSALQVAERNAISLKANVSFFHADILNFAADEKYDLIVSNPPYVRESEKKAMHNNVLEYEPSKALFVTDEDPLLFYQAIIRFAKVGLIDNGAIFFEVNQYLASDVGTLLGKENYKSIQINKDINGNDRFVSAIKI